MNERGEVDRKIEPTATISLGQSTTQEVAAEAETLTEEVSPVAALQRVAAAPPRALRPADILALQRTAGNQAVQRLLAARSSRPSAGWAASPSASLAKPVPAQPVGPASSDHPASVQRQPAVTANPAAAPELAAPAPDRDLPLQRLAQQQVQQQLEPGPLRGALAGVRLGPVPPL